MLLSDGELQLAIVRGELTITPPLLDDSEQLKSASIDLRLGEYIRTQKEPESDSGAVSDISDAGFHQYMENYTELTNIAATGGFLIKPGDFIIAYTLERIGLERVAFGQGRGEEPTGPDGHRGPPYRPQDRSRVRRSYHP